MAELSRAFGAWWMSALLASALLGCGPATRPVPPDAQLVRVSVMESEVVLTPARVSAGEIHLVLEGPILSASFIGQAGPDATPGQLGPMDDEQADRVAHGDLQGTGLLTLEVGCSDEQRAAELGRIGHCGNVFPVVVSQGKYIVAAANPGRPPDRLAVLDVGPQP